jgi:hypothetical protein
MFSPPHSILTENCFLLNIFYILTLFFMNKNIFVRFPCVLLHDRAEEGICSLLLSSSLPSFPIPCTIECDRDPTPLQIYPWFVSSCWISFALTNNCSVGRYLQLSSTFSIRRHFRFNYTCLVYLYFLLLSSVHRSPIS